MSKTNRIAADIDAAIELLRYALDQQQWSSEVLITNVDSHIVRALGNNHSWRVDLPDEKQSSSLLKAKTRSVTVVASPYDTRGQR